MKRSSKADFGLSDLPTRLLVDNVAASWQWRTRTRLLCIKPVLLFLSAFYSFFAQQNFATYIDVTGSSENTWPTVNGNSANRICDYFKFFPMTATEPWTPVSFLPIEMYMPLPPRRRPMRIAKLEVTIEKYVTEHCRWWRRTIVPGRLRVAFALNVQPDGMSLETTRTGENGGNYA